MDDINVPTHETHLQAKDGLVGAVIRQDKLDCVAICYPDKALAVTHVPNLIHCPIPSKAFAKVRVEEPFIATTPT